MNIKFYFIILSIFKIIVNSTSLSSSNSYNSNDNSYYLDTVCEFADTINNNDQYELYYLQAPLMEAEYGNLGEKFNAYHSGIALYNLNGGVNITADYYALPNLVNAIFPQNITKNNTSGEYDLIWNTYGSVQVTNYINETYWDKRELIMYSLNGYQAREFLTWIATYNSSHPQYNLFNIVSNSTRGEIYIPSNTCDDFVWACFNSLYQLGGKLISVQSAPNKDIVQLFTNKPPVIVDYSNSTQRNELANFYLNLLEIAKHKNESATIVFEEIIKLFNGTFFVYISNTYYQLDLSNHDPVSFTYDSAPMPSGIQNKSSIDFLANCNINNNRKNRTFLSNFSTIQIVLILTSIIFVSVIILYLSVGLIVNKIRGKSGSELIPNKKLWTSIGSLIKSKVNGGKNSGAENRPLLYGNINTIQ